MTAWSICRLLLLAAVRLSGELGLYACKPFEKGEVCQAQSPWQALPLAELQSTEHALLIRQIRDQLGRTKQYVLRGWNENMLTTQNSRFMCVVVHVPALDSEAAHVEACGAPSTATSGRTSKRTWSWSVLLRPVQWVAAHRIEAGDECLWCLGLVGDRPASLADT